MTALILKPDLIPLIPAKFLAPSGEIDLKVITCTECNSAYSRAMFQARPQRPLRRGKSFQDGSGCVNGAGFWWQHYCSHVLYLPPTEHRTSWSFKSFHNIWRIRFNYIFKRQCLKTRIPVFRVPVFNSDSLAQHGREQLQVRSAEARDGECHSSNTLHPGEEMPKHRSLKWLLMKQTRTEKISVRLGRLCHGQG